METYTVTVKYAIGDTLPQTFGTLTIKRTAKDASTAIATVTAILSALSNYKFDSGSTHDIPYFQVLKAYTADV